MSEDPSCCGTGTCIIDSEGRCWCGQHWDREKLGLPVSGSQSEATPPQLNDEDG